jgi:hypothetical protein
MHGGAMPRPAKRHENSNRCGSIALKLVKNLLEGSGSSIAGPVQYLADFTRPHGKELFQLLSVCNGAFLYDYALRILPSHDCELSYGLSSWNSKELWKFTYARIPPDLFCFADDVFGNQFALLGDAIVVFQCETGDIEFLASTFEEFAGRVILDSDYLTGRSILNSWRKANGRLLPRDKLVARRPFVLGGEYTAQNLAAVESARSMRIRGPIASKISELPDGAILEIEIAE